MIIYYFKTSNIRIELALIYPPTSINIFKGFKGLTRPSCQFDKILLRELQKRKSSI